MPNPRLAHALAALRSAAPDPQSAAGALSTPRGWADRCFVCGEPRPGLRHSAHWRARVCAFCLAHTKDVPVGLVCEGRRTDGWICGAPARHGTACDAHRPAAHRPPARRAERARSV